MTVKSLKENFARCLAASFTALLMLASSAFAGPPLICHPIEIGRAQSLPWTSNSWNLSGAEKYDLNRLVPDTLAILDSGAPVLVRMETLRRATLYARQDPEAARQLLAALVARTTANPKGEAPNALALFDAGYLIACYKQWIGRNLPHMTDHMRLDANPAANLDGYALVKQALALRNNDAEMEFAAALMTMDSAPLEHQQHAAKAIAGASQDALLAQNLRSRYLGDPQMTVAEVFAKDTRANQ